MARFEDRLWSELVEQHGALLAEPPARVAPARAPARLLMWRRPLVAGGLALAAALAALVIGLSNNHGRSAYAVVSNPDGTVTLSLSEMIGAEPANERLRELGVPVRVVPERQGCPTTAAQLRGANLSPGRTRQIYEPEGSAGSYRARIDPAAIPPGDTLVLRGREVRPGVVALRALVVEGPAPSCVAPVPGE